MFVSQESAVSPRRAGSGLVSESRAHDTARRTPWVSVRGLITGGFGLLVLILACVTAGAIWQTQRHQSELEELQFHSTRASLIQNVETQASVAGLLLQRYVDAGGDEYVQEINDHATAAQLSLQQVLNMGGPPGFERVTSSGLQLLQDAARAAELRRHGDVDLARGVLEEIVPLFRTYRLTLEEMAAQELAQVAQLREQADETGRLTFWLLVASGSIGVILGLGVAVFIARSIIGPLGSLEATALAVSQGDLDARAPVNGPRELSHLGQTINSMMATIQERTTELQERNRQLLDARALASTDGLTGVLNHRAFQERIREQIASHGLNFPVSLIMLDIDKFKQINDKLGHQKGDQILRDCTERCVQIAGRDCVYRYGGDEIAVMVPGKNIADAATVAERLRAGVAELDSFGTSVTISLGVSSYPQTADAPEELIYQADAAMYVAKSAGKDRVARWDEVGGMRPVATHR